MKLDLTKIDVVELLNELGMMKIKRDGNEVTFSCPFGLHMKGGAISMRADTTQFSCFGCGAKGNALTFLEELEELDTKEAIKWLGERWDISRKIETNDFKSIIRKRLERSEKKRTQVIEPVNYTIPIIPFSELEDREVDWNLVYKVYQSNPNSWEFANYIFSRGFTVETLIDWNIGWDELSQTFSIPYFDSYGNLIGFKGRSLPGIIPKYRGIGNTNKEQRYNFNTLDVSQTLFGIDRFKDNSSGDMILCEGELNCISMHQDGFTNTVGISGQYLSDRHIELIKEHATKVILVFDEWSRMVEIAEQLRKFIPVSIVRDHDKDPADMTFTEKHLLLTNRLSGILVR